MLEYLKSFINNDIEKIRLLPYLEEIQTYDKNKLTKKDPNNSNNSNNSDFDMESEYKGLWKVLEKVYTDTESVTYTESVADTDSEPGEKIESVDFTNKKDINWINDIYYSNRDIMFYTLGYLTCYSTTYSNQSLSYIMVLSGILVFINHSFGRINRIRNKNNSVLTAFK
jgi:hypothetical protein